jgi:hypothetical protein
MLGTNLNDFPVDSSSTVSSFGKPTRIPFFTDTMGKVNVGSIATVLCPETYRHRLPWHDEKKTGLVSGFYNAISVTTNASGNAIVHI